MEIPFCVRTRICRFHDVRRWILNCLGSGKRLQSNMAWHFFPERYFYLGEGSTYTNNAFMNFARLAVQIGATLILSS